MESSCWNHQPGSTADLPMERFTLDASGPLCPSIARFTLSPLNPLEELFFSWKALVGIAPCTYNVCKAARRSVPLADFLDSAFSFSHSEVRATLRSRKTVIAYKYPKASFCERLLSFKQPKHYQQQMKFIGFASKSFNKLIHSLNGNYVSFEIDTSKFPSQVWKASFSLPNGMDRPTFCRFYGIMLRSIASRGGGPGSRWTNLQACGRSWKTSAQVSSPSSSGHQPPIYAMTDLCYDDPSGQDHNSDDIMLCLIFQYHRAPTYSVQSGYQDRRALRGTSRGYRSQSSYARRLASPKSKQQESRKDFRQWKSRCKDSSLTHRDQDPNPLICPKPAAQYRLCSQSRSYSQGYNQLRHVNKPVAVPVPTGFSLQLATWNVEGLREIAKYDQIISFLNSKQIHLLAVQETKCQSVNTFNKSGWEILHSGASNAKHHGVGFFVSPSPSPHAYHFLAHSPRICEITIRANPHPITVFSSQAPSAVEDPCEDQARKDHFWSQLDSIVSERHNSSHLIILGDYNSRLDSYLDPDHDHKGPQVWGKGQSIPDPDRDNAVFLMEFMQSHLLLLPQTFSILPSAKLAAYKKMTSTTDFLEDFSVSDWTTLDFASNTHPIFCDSMSEPNIALRSLSTGRAPGPDTIPAGMIKGSPYVLKLFLFDDSKHCLSTSTVPDSWALSEVVMLVKKSSRIHVISLTIARSP